MSWSRVLGGAAFCAGVAVAPAAWAVDGCKILICLAGPWKNISQCKSDVEQVMRDTSRGKPFPVCEMGGGGAAGVTQAGETPIASWTVGYGDPNCPPQYVTTQMTGGDNPQTIYSCRYSGVATVLVNGQLWSKTYFDGSANSITDWSPAALTQLKQPPDPQWLADLADYQARLAAEAAAAALVAANPATGGGGGN